MARSTTRKPIATSAVPKQYDLTLEPDLDKAVFSGSVTILYDFSSLSHASLEF